MTFQQAEISDARKLKEILECKTPVNWVFAGDSVTAGVGHTHGQRSYTEIFAERIRHECGRSLDHFINSGVSGHTSRDVVFYFDWCVKQFNPSVVSVMTGINDCSQDRTVTINSFRENLLFLVDSIRALGAVPVLQTPNAIMSERAPERLKLTNYVDAVRNIAETNDVILIDHWSYWQDMAQTYSHPSFKQWLDDALHPNGAGHLQIAWLIFQNLFGFMFNDAHSAGLVKNKH